MAFFQVITAVANLINIAMPLLKEKSQTENAAPGEFKKPDTQEGKPVPFIFGTVVEDEPTVVWRGDLKIVPVKSKGGKK